MLPLVTAIMPTANRRQFVPTAIADFMAQTYPNKQLIVLDDGDRDISDLIPKDERIIYVYLHRRLSIGAKRNLAASRAAGVVIAHQDDDDRYAPERLEYQVRLLIESGKDVCGFCPCVFFDERTHTAKEYSSLNPNFAVGASLVYRRDWWRVHPFEDRNEGEDVGFVKRTQDSIVVVPAGQMMAARTHAGNTSKRDYANKINWRDVEWPAWMESACTVR